MADAPSRTLAAAVPATLEAPPAPNPQILAGRKLLKHAMALAKTGGRTDLVARLKGADARLADPGFTIMVVGEYKQGKSSLINGLLGVKVCPVDDDVATSVPTRVRYGKTPTARVVRRGPDGEPTEPKAVPLERIPELVTEGGNPGNAEGFVSLTIQLPHPLLQAGLVLVDTPGVGGLGSSHTATTVAALQEAEAVVLVSDAGQEYTAPEMEFLALARDLCPNLLGVLSKTDIFGEWHRIHELNQAHLRDSGLRSALMPVSSALRERALTTRDPGLNAESGYPVLLQTISQQVIPAAERLTLRGVANDVLSSVAQLQTRWDAEVKVLTDPAASAEVMRGLETAKAKADELRSQASKWSQTLADGFADLNADADYDFRKRTRAVAEEGEDALEQGDPARGWDDFEAWLKRRVASEVAADYAFITGRLQQIAAQVGERFDEAEGEIGHGTSAAAPDAILENIDVDHDTGGKLQNPTLAARGMNAIRGSYGGFSMFGMLGGYVGLGMVNPFTIVVGVLMGGKAITDEKQRLVAQRRQQAKAAMRKYIEEVSFEVGKDARESLRHAQRDLRDFFAKRAEELQRSVTEALTSAQEAVKSSEAERTKRLKELEASLRVAAELRALAGQVAPGLTTAATATADSGG